MRIWKAYKQIGAVYNTIVEMAAEFSTSHQQRKKEAEQPAAEDKGGEKPKKLTTAHELFQLLVGEIGISRHEFYYELRWWEVRAIVEAIATAIIRDGNRRDLVAYNAHFCMGSKTTPPIVSEWLPFPTWERRIHQSKLTESDISEMQR